MSFDKTKAMKNAERFLAQGKLRAAISEYKNIMEKDSSDYNTLNMLGDLYVKATEIEDAVVCFSKVAEHYNKQGFSQKAIAIYNKISKLKPDSLEVSSKLAQLYQMKGSIAEARVHYNVMAEQYTKVGKKTEAMMVWKQIASLDPNNTDIYLKIADACWQDDQKGEAAHAYIEAGVRLNAKKQYESAVTAFSRALEIKPEDMVAMKGFVDAQINLGYAEDAAKVLEEAIEINPYNRELLQFLIDCYLETEDILEAEKITVKLVEQEPSNYPRLLDLVKVYLKKNDYNSAIRPLSMASEHLLVGGQAETLEKYLNDILIQEPELVDALRLLVRFQTWQRDDAGIKTALERLAEAARVNNSVEDEKYALNKLITICPQISYYVERYNELNGNTTTFGFNEFGDHNSEVPKFESYQNLTEIDTDSALNQIEKDSFDGFIDDGHISVISSDKSVFDENTAQDLKGTTIPKETADFAVDNGLNGKFNWGADESSETNSISFEVKPDYQEEISNENLVNSVKEEFKDLGLGANQELSEFEKHSLLKEIEGLDFYVAQGFRDLAEKTLDDIETRYGKNSLIDEARISVYEKLISANGGKNSEVISETDSLNEISESEIAQIYQDVKNSQISSDLDNNVKDNVSDNENQSSLPAKISEVITHNDNNQLFQSEELTSLLEQSLSSIENEPKQEEKFQNVNFDHEFIKQSQPIEENLNDFVAQINSLSNESKGKENSPDIAQTNQETSNQSDFETHFQTGIVYKEMGILEESIAEFQKAIKLVTPEDGTRRYYKSCNMLGLCFIEKQMPNLALIWFKKCLENKKLTEDELQGLNYEIANAYERGGDFAKAKEHFEMIYAFNVGFRDVGERLNKLLSK